MKKDYTKYYTPIEIADILMQLIHIHDGCKVIDICCGSGNLLNSAKKINNNIELFGIDIVQSHQFDFEFQCIDGRKFATKAKNKKSFDIVLGNPPFGNSYEKNTYGLFCDIFKDFHTKRLEIEMLIANLMLLKHMGTLLIIMPTSFIESKTLTKLRRVIANNYFIDSLVDLPINAFGSSRIKCHAIIIIKKKDTINTTKKYQITDNLLLIRQRDICVEDIQSGNWYEHRAIENNINFKILRGNISSNSFNHDGSEILHSSALSNYWQPSTRKVNLDNLKKESNIASKGDIIICRIGSAAGSLCVYEGKDKYISDCLMVIKNPPSNLYNELLCCELKKKVKGLSTPHITVADVYSEYCKYKSKNKITD